MEIMHVLILITNINLLSMTLGEMEFVMDMVKGATRSDLAVILFKKGTILGLLRVLCLEMKSVVYHQNLQ
jgi:hypothetical protein